MSKTPKAHRDDYPVCPKCGRPMAIAMMTTGGRAVKHRRQPETVTQRLEWFYHPDAVSLYCTSADCNHDLPAASIPYPPPPPGDPKDINPAAVRAGLDLAADILAMLVTKIKRTPGAPPAFLGGVKHAQRAIVHLRGILDGEPAKVLTSPIADA